MAEVAVAAVKIAATTTKIVIPLIKDEITKFIHVHKTFQELETSMKGAENLLQQIDLSQDNPILRDRVKNLQRFCYEVEDLIYDMKHEIEKRDENFLQTDPTKDAAKSSLKNLWKPHQIHGKLKELKSKIEEVEKNQQPKDDAEIIKVPTEGVNFSFSQLKTMGIEEHTVTKIIEKLTSRDFNGVSILGIRGMGKRALARYILDQEGVQAKFPLILKASFSGNNFDRNHRILDVVYDRDSVRQSDQNNILLLEKLDQIWLLWVDDLSDMPIHKWDDFKNSFLTDANKMRKVLFTTVNPDIATTTTTFPYYMNGVSETCCRDLINDVVLTTNRNLSSAFFRFGSIWEIAKKCYGSPLVAKHLGLALCRHKKDYHHIVEDELWRLSEFKDELLPYLASTFQNLNRERLHPLYYLSLFPQGHQFDKEDTVLLWIGAGLFQAQTTQSRASSVIKGARDCFNDLLKNSILQPLSDEPDSGPYIMNELAHNFAQFVAPKIYVRWNDMSRPQDLDDINICHLSLTCNIPPQSPQLWDKIKTRKCLRTFLSLHASNNPGQLKEIPHDIFSKMVDLRVLVLKNTNINRFPPSITSLKRLRYIDISGTLIEEFNLCTLDSLQILKFKKTLGSTCPFRLDKDFSNLTNLVFVDWEVEDINNLPLKPCHIGKLVNLMTLPLFVVGNKDGHRIDELKDLNHLQNSIRISKLEYVLNEEQAKGALLGMKTSLQRLELEWTDKQNDCTRARNVLNNLKPHDGLSDIQIINYCGYLFPAWFSKDTFAIQKVHFKNCKNCDKLPSIGLLPALEAIHLEEFPVLTSINHLFGGTSGNSTIRSFASLRSLVLSDMETLENWTELGVNDMPGLQELKIRMCPMLKSLPSLAHLTSLEAIEIEYCKALRSLPKLPSSLTSLIIVKSDSLAKWCRTDDQGRSIVNRSGLKVAIDSKPIGLPSSEFSQDRHSQEGSSPLAKALSSIANQGLKKS